MQEPAMQVERSRKQPTNGDALQCSFTIDVEDWYQSCIDFDAPISERVVRNVHLVRSFLDESGVKATFFVQGRVAETYPQLVRELLSDGHEIQSHGYSHRPLFKMNRKDLLNELDYSLKTLEDACGVRVTAFRAQDFSIMQGNLWALEVLAEVGFTVDSSIFPIRMKRYGVAGWETAPHHISFASGRELLEVPVAVWSVSGMRLPVGGGGYFRLLPGGLLQRAVRSTIKAGLPVVIYSHPYEFNSQELGDYRETVSWRYLRMQGLGRRGFPEKVRQLFKEFRFGRFDTLIAPWGRR